MTEANYDRGTNYYPPYLVVSVVHHRRLAGPRDHFLNNEIGDTSDEEIGSAAGTKRMTRIVVNRQTKPLGD